MSRLEQVLEDCLDQLINGEATLEDCLALYPEHAAELRRLWATAGKLEQGRRVQPSPIFRARARARLRAHMNAHPRGRSARWWSNLMFSRLPLAFGRALSVASTLAVMLCLFLATGTVLAQMARPGDPLYSWRTASERVWRNLHPDPLEADLTLSNRHARDLTDVAGDPEAEQLALQDYERTLAELSSYYKPDSHKIISEALVEQKDNLEQADLTVPALEALLAKVSVAEIDFSLDNQATLTNDGFITYRLVITNHNPSDLVTATLISALSPAEALVSLSGAGCGAAQQGVMTCTVRSASSEALPELTVTAAIEPCYAGFIRHTALVTGTTGVVNVNPNYQAVAESQITLPFPGSARLVYVQSDGQSHELDLITPAGARLNNDLHRRAAAPAWSPDGTTLAFVGEAGISDLGGEYSKGNGVWLIDIVNNQGQNPRQLVSQDHIKSLAWSPDGSKLAFEVGEPGMPHHEVAVVNAADGQPISRFSGEHPAWSSDGQTLVIKACLPGCGLWQVNPDGSGGQQLTFDSSDSYPTWSPTGQEVAFASQRDGDWEIYRLRLAGKELIRVTDRPGTDTTPVFGACGQELYVRTDAEGSWWITVMRLDGSDERKVAEGVGPSDEWGLARPAIYY